MACEVTGGDQRRKVVVKARSGSNGVGLKKINKINDLAGPEGFFSVLLKFSNDFKRLYCS
jgi:hypothetical protein